LQSNLANVLKLLQILLLLLPLPLLFQLTLLRLQWRCAETSPVPSGLPHAAPATVAKYQLQWWCAEISSCTKSDASHR